MIVIGVHQEQVGSRLVAPLEAGADVDVVALLVVPDIRSEEKRVGKRDIDARTNEPEMRVAPAQRSS